MTRRANGFSLIEMAFVLVIVTLLLGGLLVPFATQVEQKRIVETQKAMEEIKEALLGYALTNKQLPCPATSATDGIALATCTLSGTAVSVTGYLPWATLGVNRSDAWGRLYRYAVSLDFTTTIALPTYNSTGTCLTPSCSVIDINTRSSDGTPTTLASNTVALVISHGKNGYGGMSDDGLSAIAPATSTDENTNAVATNNFMTRAIVPPSSPCGALNQPFCEFDDIVTWLSPNVLFNRMVAAGQLP